MSPRRGCLFGALCLLAYIGCVSGTMKMIRTTDELPEELSKDLQDRYQVKEHAAAVPKVEKTKKKKLSKRKKDRERTLASSRELGEFKVPLRRRFPTPVWLSERLDYSIRYFGVKAGNLSLEVLPYKMIDARKVYHIRGLASSSPVFGVFYRLNDTVESFIDYDGVFSHRLHVMLDESKQERDSLELNDSRNKQTFFWNRWNHKVNGYKEVKEFAAIEPFSQDSVSALYYVRNLNLVPGMVVTFPVISEGKSFEAVCTVLRREEMDTPLGTVQTLVIRPEMKFQGILKKTGDSFLWLTDDDRKIPVRLEAKVRVGVVVAELKKAELGISPDQESGPTGGASPVGTPIETPSDPAQ